MTTTIASAARAVAADFFPAEEHLDEAALRAARCVATMMEQRRAAGLPRSTGARAILHMSRAATLALEGSQEIARAHALLRPLATDLGAPMAFGDTEPCVLTGVALPAAPSGDVVPLRSAA